MALTVSSDLTVITNGNDGSWNDIGGGSGSASEPDYFVQGTGSRSRAVSGASASRGMAVDIGGSTLDFSSGGANEDELVYFWIQCYTPGLTDALSAAPGLRIRMSEGGASDPASDFAEWDIAYSDLLADTNLPGTEFFRVYVIDPRSPPTRTTGTWDYNAVRHFGAVLDTNATAKGQNLGIDRICYGRGELIVTGTPDTVNGGFEEIISDAWATVNDSVAIGSTATARHGILSVRGRTAFMKGKLVFGDDAGTAATDFSGVGQAFEWEDTFYYDGTRIRSAVGYDDSQNFTGRDSNGVAYYGVEFRGNGTGDTAVDFGVAVGATQGRSGPRFTGSQITPTALDADDGAVEGVAIYGSTFADFRYLDLAANASTDVFRGNNLENCGPLDVGPTEGRNNNLISGIGANYTFLETFRNIEAGAAEQLSTADPTTEWTDLLNGADWSIPDEARYVELLGGTTRTNITLLDDDKVGSDDHYAEFIVNFPAGGSGQGTLGPVIAGDSAAQDYFYFEVDLVNDHCELFRVNTGTDTSIAGSGAAGDFTMDEDEDYLVLLRRDGTTIEAFISGNSAADNFHTLKLSATDSAHTGTTHRLPGLRGDALAGQSGDAPQVRLWGCGPITDEFGSIVLPTTANWDYEDINLINCTRGLSTVNTGTYSFTNIDQSANLVAFHNDAGAVTGNYTGASAPENSENLGSATTTLQASVNVQVTIVGEDGNPIQNVQTSVYLASDDSEVINALTNASGVVSSSYAGSTPANIYIRWRLSSTGSTRYFPDSATGVIEAGTGYTGQFVMRENPIVQP